MAAVGREAGWDAGDGGDAGRDADDGGNAGGDVGDAGDGGNTGDAGLAAIWAPARPEIATITASPIARTCPIAMTHPVALTRIFIDCPLVVITAFVSPEYEDFKARPVKPTGRFTAKTKGG